MDAGPRRAPSVDRRRCGSRRSFVPNDPDPRSAIAWPNIQLCMQLFDRLVEAWPERTIVPSLAERWEIADDGLRYVFQLREGLTWSDGAPLTAHDVEYGIKRVLDPAAPGSSAAIYFVLENGQDYCLGRNTDAVGDRRPRARRPDRRVPSGRAGAVLPERHEPSRRRPAAEACDRARRTLGRPAQVVSGAVPDRRAATKPRSCSSVAPTTRTARGRGNIERVEYARVRRARTRLQLYARGELDMVAVRYTPRLADRVVKAPPKRHGRRPCRLDRVPRVRPHRPDGVERRCSGARSPTRSTATRSPSCCPRTCSSRRAGSCRPRCRGTRRTSSPASIPSLRASCSPSRVSRARCGSPASRTGRDIIELIARGWSEVLGLRVETPTWTPDHAWQLPRPWEEFIAPIVVTGWLPGYPDPEYYLRLLLHSESKTNEGGYAYAPFDELIERARQERRTASGSSCTTPPTGWRSRSRRR